MPVLCFGPVCIPLNLLLPFLLGIAHRYGWLKWVRREWLTFSWWKQQFSRSRQSAAGAVPAVNADSHTTNSKAGIDAGAAASGPNYVCEGGVCRIVPPEAGDDGQEPADDSSSTAATGAAASKLRHRRA